MLDRIPQAKSGSFSVRPARTSDTPEIAHLLESCLTSHLHPDWRPVTDWIGQAPAFVAEASKQLVAFLIAPADPPPTAWLRAAAVRDNYSPAVVMRKLLAVCLADLAERNIGALSAMPVEPWLPPILDDLGLAIVEQVENWGKPDLHINRPGNPDVLVRRARRNEMDRLVLIERAAFAPRWWHSSETLALAWDRALIFTVAEFKGELVGFQISMSHEGQAHLARITVHPAVQGQGVGSRLLADTLARYAAFDLQQVNLNTQTDNFPSHHLYTAFGFQRVNAPTPVWERPV